MRVTIALIAALSACTTLTEEAFEEEQATAWCEARQRCDASVACTNGPPPSQPVGMDCTFDAGAAERCLDAWATAECAADDIDYSTTQEPCSAVYTCESTSGDTDNA